MCAAVIAATWTTSCRYDYELLELPGGISSDTSSSSGGVAGGSTSSVGSTSTGGTATSGGGATTFDTASNGGSTSAGVDTSAGDTTGSGGSTASGGASGPVGGSGGSTETDLVVTTAADEEDAGATLANPLGSGLSLREAIQIANLEAGGQTITFSGEFSIALASAPLPTITESVELLGPVTVEGAGVPSQTACLAVDASDVSIRFLTVYNCPAEPVLVLDGTGHEISDCNFIDSAQSLAVTGQGHRILRNTIVGSDGAGIWCNASDSNLLDNWVVGSAAVGIYATDAASTTSIVGNTLLRNGFGIAVALATNVVIAHNTVVDCGIGVAIDGATQVDFRNNIVVGSSGEGVSLNSGDFLELDASLYFGNGGSDCLNCTPGPASVFADPRFVDYAADDLTLQGDSPAVDQAIDLGLDRNAGSSGTFNGLAPDLGAFESD